MDDYCKERVHNDFGVSSHGCTRKAVQDGYCRQHYDMRNPPEELPARQHQAEPRGNTSITLTSRLRWDVMDAPTYKAKYAAKAIFVTTLSFKLTNGSDQVFLEATGPVRKKDGSAGLSNQREYVDADRLAETTQQVVQDEVNRLRAVMRVAEQEVGEDGE